MPYLRCLRACALLLVLAGSATAQTVFFSPAQSVPAAPEFTVEMRLTTGGAAAMGLDVVFTHDPAIVHLDSVTVGAWFADAPAGHFFWTDPAAPVGTTHLTGSVFTAGRTVDGVAAVLHFSALAVGVSPLDFLSVTMRDELNADLGAQASVGDEILIDPVIPTTRMSFGAMKALWR